MRTRIGLMRALLFGMVLAFAGEARAQCVTPTKKVAASLNAKDAFAIARAEGTRWMADSVLVRMQATTAGPMNAAGLASHWMFEFSSKGARKLNVINLLKGEMTCSVASIDLADEAVPVTADTIMDTERLYGIAQQAGGSAQDPKHVNIVAMLDQNADHVTAWTVTYVTPQGMPLLSVKINARSGAVIAKTAR